MTKDDTATTNHDGAADGNDSTIASPSAGSNNNAATRKRKGLTPEEQLLLESEKKSKREKNALAVSKVPRKKANKGESSSAAITQLPTRPKTTGKGKNGNMSMNTNNMLPPPFAGGVLPCQNPMMTLPQPANMIQMQAQMNQRNMMQQFMKANANMKMMNNNNHGIIPRATATTTAGVPKTTTATTTTTKNSSTTTNASVDTIKLLTQQLIETQKALALVTENALNEVRQKYEEDLAKEKEKTKQQTLTIQRLKDQLKKERQAHAETKKKINKQSGSSSNSID